MRCLVCTYCTTHVRIMLTLVGVAGAMSKQLMAYMSPVDLNTISALAVVVDKYACGKAVCMFIRLVLQVYCNATVDSILEDHVSLMEAAYLLDDAWSLAEATRRLIQGYSGDFSRIFNTIMSSSVPTHGHCELSPQFQNICKI